MNIAKNKRLMGLMLAPFALFTACVGLTPEEQAEYKQLQDEVRRIQSEEIEPRQEELKKIIEGKLVIDVSELQEKINQIKNERLAPLEHKVASLRSGDGILAAPGTRIELEELNGRLKELKLLYAGLQQQITEHSEQLAAAKNVAAAQIEGQISLLEIELNELLQQLEDLERETDLRATEIDGSLDELRGLLESLEPDSADADEVRGQIAALESEWEAIHGSEAELKAEIDQTVNAIEAEIHALRGEIESRQKALVEQFGSLIHGLEISLHDVSEEKEVVVRKIHELELSAPEELEKTINELENLIEEIVTEELRPLIERINEANRGEDNSSAEMREELRVELEEWLSKIAGLRARMNELTARSFQSLLGGLNLGGLAGLAQS